MANPNPGDFSYTDIETFKREFVEHLRTCKRQWHEVEAPLDEIIHLAIQNGYAVMASADKIMVANFEGEEPDLEELGLEIKRDLGADFTVESAIDTFRAELAMTRKDVH